MFGNVAKIAFLGIALQYFLAYRDWLDWETDLKLSVRPGPCEYVLEDGGSEDLTHIGDGIVLLSTGLNSVGGNPGYIKAFNTTNGNLETLSVVGAPSRSDFLSSPHGLSAWRDPRTGQTFLYLITHPQAADVVEVFEVMQSPLRLRHVRSITDSNFRLMNDLLVVDKDKFYITKFAHYRENVKYNIELLSRWKSGKVYFYDGYKSREVVSGLLQPNGINISPDKSVVYMAEWGTKHLIAYKRESTNNLVEIWNFNLDTGIDNIEVDPVSGDLWIGSHPIIWRTIDPLHLLNVNHASQVLRVKMVDNAVSEVEEILSDDGDYVAGTSSATYVNGKLVVGTVFKQVLLCDVSYLSRSRNESMLDAEHLPKSYVANDSF